MTLPRLLVLTDRTQAAKPLAAVVREAVGHGARAVVLRENDLGYAQRAQLATELQAALAPVGGTLIVAGGGGSAVHLAARDGFPDPRPAIVGRSCHDAAEVARAAAEGCDYVTVSPVYATASKPGYGPALGPAGLGALCNFVSLGGTAVPVFALGGVFPEHVADCRRAGAYGVAVMGPVMREPELVAAYLAALSEDPA